MHSYRRLVLSDTHLGAFQSDPAALLYCLSHTDFSADETLILGDFLDDWSLVRSKCRNHSLFDRIANTIRLRNGVTHIQGGDHDAVMMQPVTRQKLENCLNAEIQDHYRTQDYDGRHIVAIHGHQLDGAAWQRNVHRLYGICEPPMTGVLGSGEMRKKKGAFATSFNKACHRIHQALACSWSHITGFRRKMQSFARLNDIDILLTGHIHYPFITRDSDNRILANAGNYRSALAETYDGQWHIIELPSVTGQQAYDQYCEFMRRAGVAPTREAGFTALLDDIFGRKAEDRRGRHNASPTSHRAP